MISTKNNSTGIIFLELKKQAISSTLFFPSYSATNNLFTTQYRVALFATLLIFLNVLVCVCVYSAKAYTAYYFLRNDRALCTSKGIETLKVAVALALGIAIVCSIPLPKRHAASRQAK